MKNILVGIDLDEYSEILIEKAVEISSKFGSKIWLLHVAAPEPEFVGYEGGPQFIRNVRATELRKENKQLNEFSAQIKENGIDAEGLLIQGATVETIFEEARVLNIDLIIAGHHEHGFFYKLFFGSTAAELVRRSKIPVLVVPFGH